METVLKDFLKLESDCKLVYQLCYQSSQEIDALTAKYQPRDAAIAKYKLHQETLRKLNAELNQKGVALRQYTCSVQKSAQNAVNTTAAYAIPKEKEKPKKSTYVAPPLSSFMVKRRRTYDEEAEFNKDWIEPQEPAKTDPTIPSASESSASDSSTTAVQVSSSSASTVSSDPEKTTAPPQM